MSMMQHFGGDPNPEELLENLNYKDLEIQKLKKENQELKEKINRLQKENDNLRNIKYLLPY